MPLTADDRLDILDLLARYNHAIDDADTDAWLACWTDDGVYEFPPDRRHAGREELRAAAETRAADASRPASRHWLNSIVIEGDGDAARVTCYLALVRPEMPPRINHTGRYDLEARKVGGQWKFCRRTLLRGV